MIKSILAPTDMSDRSDQAIRTAHQLAAKHGASLQIFHVIDDATPSSMTEALRSAAEEALSKTLAKLPNNVDTTIVNHVGDPTSDVISRVENSQPDLVIMGTHRRRALFDGLRETTVQRVTRLTFKPVLMVANDSAFPDQPIVAATDFSPAAASAISLANTLFPESAIAPVHAFHVPFAGLQSNRTDMRDSLTAAFRKELQAADHTWRQDHSLPSKCSATEITPGGPYQVLSTAVEAKKAQTICVGAHGFVGQRRAFLGSVASDLTSHPPCDVLVARP